MFSAATFETYSLISKALGVAATVYYNVLLPNYATSIDSYTSIYKYIS